MLGVETWKFVDKLQKAVNVKVVGVGLYRQMENYCGF